nr:hypothetical protein Iba_chr10eCG11520 [Ipomoea batatas]
MPPPATIAVEVPPSNLPKASGKRACSHCCFAHRERERSWCRFLLLLHRARRNAWRWKHWLSLGASCHFRTPEEDDNAGGLHCSWPVDGLAGEKTRDGGEEEKGRLTEEGVPPVSSAALPRCVLLAPNGGRSAAAVFRYLAPLKTEEGSRHVVVAVDHVERLSMRMRSPCPESSPATAETFSSPVGLEGRTAIVSCCSFRRYQLTGRIGEKEARSPLLLTNGGPLRSVVLCWRNLKLLLPLLAGILCCSHALPAVEGETARRGGEMARER